jgi:hypothetical protein
MEYYVSLGRGDQRERDGADGVVFNHWCVCCFRVRVVKRNQSETTTNVPLAFF